MGRGDFGFINSKEIYSESEKSWWVELINTNCIWYDMIINPPDGLDTSKIIKNYLGLIEKYLNEHCEKRFIYFLGTRRKVRFSTKKKASYSPFTKNLNLTLLIGQERRKFKIKYSFFEVTPNGKRKITPKIKVTEKYLYIEHDSGHVSVISIHDFLKENYIDLGINTEVHYVGYTRHPHKRPIDFIHRGLSKMLYNLSNEDNDFFVYFSIFNPRVISHNNDYNVSFSISNSQIDEVEVDKEGRIIENCFIRYFDTELQNDDKESKRPDLNNMFIDLVNHKKIKTIAVSLQYENNNEYFCFYSNSVQPQNDHFFVIDFVDGKVNIDRNKNLDAHMELVMGNHS
ncbi:hypothetical protein E0601_02905 [Salmonella enterica subsp. enterica serovar Carmel]|uniref:Uncharacterized protein n=1 Tax=Salmonella enterica TaxID=28901 RepID=A0A742XT61_SALER|nr:hypothetical protein [Salmonella enterica subsp. enterica serovar Carmel]EDP8967061.1 hypothetical protein [Salmonella enterica subsp. enterica]HAF1734844.1 hypothetical protein [Salmonella enterica]ECD4289686.1 hypothetical protein [Salmonella enterica subsp. enterica serovar Carmel]ECF3809084.1 hypothetical protein [Salmonella enterica subsp. enterica serovar Carmel]